MCVCVYAACIYLCSQTNLPFWHHKRGSCSSDRVINENKIHTIKYLWQLPRGEDVAQGRRELLLVDTHNALPLALIYLASAIQGLSQCQKDTSHGGRGNGHNEPLHQAREFRMEARAEAEAGAASLEAFALLVLCSHCAAIALVICSSRDFNALTRSSTSRLRNKRGRWRWRLRLTK